jgi:crossover junction endodeoxyribonuclease RuvC
VRVIGIDPGKTGAVAVIEDNTIVELYDCPIITSSKKGVKPQYDERGMARIIQVEIARIGCPVDKIVIEKVGAMPGQGVTSMFTFGMGFGLWLGILATLPVPYELVTPQRWKKEMLMDIPGGNSLKERKARSVVAAKRLFPGLDLPRVKDHGKAEAVLIAAWGMR